jgi:hypothetical protein
VAETAVPDGACCALGYRSVGLGHEQNCEIRQGLATLPDSVRRSRFGCDVAGCQAHPMKGDLVIRISPKGAPFRGRCEPHYYAAAVGLRRNIVVWLHAAGFHDAATALAEIDVADLAAIPEAA